jgi:hypothetical protein
VTRKRIRFQPPVIAGRRAVVSTTRGRDGHAAASKRAKTWHGSAPPPRRSIAHEPRAGSGPTPVRTMCASSEGRGFKPSSTSKFASPWTVALWK